jgi:hypothetical protein
MQLDPARASSVAAARSSSDFSGALARARMRWASSRRFCAIATRASAVVSTSLTTSPELADSSASAGAHAAKTMTAIAAAMTSTRRIARVLCA